MSSVKKISTLSEWNSTEKNRIKLLPNGLSKIFYFDHLFSGLSVDSNYWQVINQTGDSLYFNNHMYVSVSDDSYLTELRSRNFYSGNFDIYVSYSDFDYDAASDNRYIYFGLSSEDIDPLNNINISIGIGIESGSVVLRSKILQDNRSSLLYENSVSKSYLSGKLRIKKDGDDINFFAENGSSVWENIGSFSHASVSANNDLFLFFSSEIDLVSGSSSSSSVSSVGTTISVIFNKIVFGNVLSQYDGNIYFNFSYDDDVDLIYYYLSGAIEGEKGAISIRIKSSDTESGLDAAPWLPFQTDLSSSFSVMSSDKFVRVNIKIISYEYGYSPLLDSVIVGTEKVLSEDEVPNVVSPSSGESFDNVIRIVWKKPDLSFLTYVKKYYKIEYRNLSIGINNWILIDNRVNPQAGYYDWIVKNLEEDDNYEIRISSIFLELIDVSESLPYRLIVENADVENLNGIYNVIGIHNGENLYEGDNGYIYYDGNSNWLLNNEIDNSSYIYYSTEVIGIWNSFSGGSFPIVSEFSLSTSESSINIIKSSSSSYDFSSSSSMSSTSSSTQIMTSSNSSLSSSSSDSSSSEILTSSQSSTSLSSLSSSSDSSESSSSTYRAANSSTSSESSSSTALLLTSSSSSVFSLLKGSGFNVYGQLGLGNNDNSNIFTKIPFNEDRYYNLISGGAYHTFLQSSDGTVWATGLNNYGQLGLGDNVDRNSFVQLPVSFNYAKKIVCGEYFSIIEKSDGSVWVSGRNNKGQLGLGDNVDRNSFISLDIKYNNPNHIAAGSEFFMIVKSNGYLDVSGANESGQLGLGDFVDRNSLQETGIKTGNSICAGSQFSYITNYLGFVKSSGNNFHGQLGLGDNVNRSEFQEVSGIINPIKMTAGVGHILIVSTSGILKACGDNGFGQLGLGDNVDRSSFEDVGFVAPESVISGYYHSLLISNVGKMYVSGYNYYGQLGLKDNNNRNVFTEVGYIYNPVDVFAFGYHSFIISQYGESESSTKLFESSSSSESIDNPIDVYPFGYFQSSELNMADAFGDFNGNAFYIPINRINSAILTYVSLSNTGDWELQKYNSGIGSYETYCPLLVGSEVSFPYLDSGDIVRVVFDGPSGTELFSYKIYMRENPENSSSSSTVLLTSSSTVLLTSSQSSSSNSSSSISSSSSGSSSQSSSSFSSSSSGSSSQSSSSSSDLSSSSISSVSSGSSSSISSVSSSSSSSSVVP